MTSSFLVVNIHLKAIVSSMKGQRKKHKFMRGNQASALKGKTLATKYEKAFSSKLAPSTHVSLTPSTQVSPIPSTEVSPTPSSQVLQNNSSDLSVWLPRLSEKQFKLYAKKSYDEKLYTNPCIGDCKNSVKLLRPIKQNDEYLNEYLDEKSIENRVVDRDLTVSMINNLTISHLQQSKKCKSPNFEILQEKQWGLGWTWILKCNNCAFISESFKLFREVENCTRGRKAGSVNYGFQTGITNTNIGNDGARLILTSAGIPPMSKAGMQKVANKVSDKIVDLSEQETRSVVQSLQIFEGYLPYSDQTLK